VNKPPTWFIVVAVLALVWNLLGCLAFVSDFSLTAADIAKLPEAQQALYNARTAWATAAMALAVFGGAAGAVGLLVRRKWAVTAFVASLVGLVVQDFGLFVVAGAASRAGSGAVVIQGMVFAIAVGLLLLGRRASARGWIR
jgi:hypothetical protein